MTHFRYVIGGYKNSSSCGKAESHFRSAHHNEMWATTKHVKDQLVKGQKILQRIIRIDWNLKHWELQYLHRHTKLGFYGHTYEWMSCMCLQLSRLTSSVVCKLLYYDLEQQTLGVSSVLHRIFHSSYFKIACNWHEGQLRSSCNHATSISHVFLANDCSRTFCRTAFKKNKLVHLKCTMVCKCKNAFWFKHWQLVHIQSLIVKHKHPHIPFDQCRHLSPCLFIMNLSSTAIFFIPVSKQTFMHTFNVQVHPQSTKAVHDTKFRAYKYDVGKRIWYP